MALLKNWTGDPERPPAAKLRAKASSGNSVHQDRSGRGSARPACRHQLKATTTDRGTRSAPRLTRVARRSGNHDGENCGNPKPKRRRSAHHKMISTMPKATGRPSAISLKRRHVPESCKSSPPRSLQLIILRPPRRASCALLVAYSYLFTSRAFIEPPSRGIL